MTLLVVKHLESLVWNFLHFFLTGSQNIIDWNWRLQYMIYNILLCTLNDYYIIELQQYLKILQALMAVFINFEVWILKGWLYNEQPNQTTQYAWNLLWPLIFVSSLLSLLSPSSFLERKWSIFLYNKKIISFLYNLKLL